MPKQEVSPHFDAEALLRDVYAQPIGLAVSTNHPASFKRLLYTASRRNAALAVQILASPNSATLFYLVRADVQVNEEVKELFEKEVTDE